MFDWSESHLELNHVNVLARVSSECRAGFSPPSAYSLTKLPKLKPRWCFKTSGPHSLTRPLIADEYAWVMVYICIHKLCFVVISKRWLAGKSWSFLKSLIIFTSVEKRREKATFSTRTDQTSPYTYKLWNKMRNSPGAERSCVLRSVFELIFWRGVPSLRRCQWEIMWQTISAISQLQHYRPKQPSTERQMQLHPITLTLNPNYLQHSCIPFLHFIVFYFNSKTKHSLSFNLKLLRLENQ